MFSTNSTKILSSGKIMHKNNICRILLSKYWCGKESVIAMSKDNALSHGALLIHCRNNQHDRCEEWRSLLRFTALNIVWLVDCIKEITSRKLSRFFVKKVYSPFPRQKIFIFELICKQLSHPYFVLILKIYTWHGQMLSRISIISFCFHLTIWLHDVS